MANSESSRTVELLLAWVKARFVILLGLGAKLVLDACSNARLDAMALIINLVYGPSAQADGSS